MTSANRKKPPPRPDQGATSSTPDSDQDFAWKPHKSVKTSMFLEGEPDPKLLAELHEHLGAAIDAANTMALHDWRRRTGLKNPSQTRDGKDLPMAVDLYLHAHMYLVRCIEGSIRPFLHDPQIVQDMKSRKPEQVAEGVRPFHPLGEAPKPPGRQERNPPHTPPFSHARTAPETRERILELHSQGMPRKRIAKLLDSEGIKGPSGGTWHCTSVGRVIDRG